MVRFVGGFARAGSVTAEAWVRGCDLFHSLKLCKTPPRPTLKRLLIPLPVSVLQLQGAGGFQEGESWGAFFHVANCTPGSLELILMNES